MNKTIFYETTSLCRICKKTLPATLIRNEENQVVFKKSCDQHGNQDVVVATNAEWFSDTLKFQPSLETPNSPRDVKQGCPFDCGPCKSHQQKIGRASCRERVCPYV